jgi:hypothetical protein
MHISKPHVNNNPGFKLPGLPASKKPISKPLLNDKPAASAPLYVNDGWDDFLDSGTQIARELSTEFFAAKPKMQIPDTSRPSISHTLPPLSTQDLDFSIDDLDDSPVSAATNLADGKSSNNSAMHMPLPSVNAPKADFAGFAQSTSGIGNPMKPSRQHHAGKRPPAPVKTIRKQQQPARVCLNIDLATLTPSQRPSSVSDRPGLKRKTPPLPSRGQQPSLKRPCAASSRSMTTSSTRVKQNPTAGFGDFGISTQEAASFFADDEDLFTGSPPITV